jgi:hypothetical protein
LLGGDGKEVRRVAAGGFEAGGERAPLSVFLLLGREPINRIPSIAVF